MQKIISVTGATGKVGSSVAKILLNKGIKVRAIARSKEKLNLLMSLGADVFPGNLEDTAFVREIFNGSDAVLAVAPDNLNEPDFKANKNKIGASVISAIKDCSIKYVVAVSSVGTDLISGIGPIGPLRQMEEQLIAIKNINAIILRSAYYMENLLTLIPMIKNSGIIGGGFAPEVRMPMVSVKDIALTASKYLSESGFRGVKVKEQLGPKDYTFPEAAAVLGKAIGKPDLRYIQFPFDELRKALMQNGFSESGAEAIIESITAHNNGRVQATLKRSEENTTPTTIEEFAENVFAKEFKAEYSTRVMS